MSSVALALYVILDNNDLNDGDEAVSLYFWVYNALYMMEHKQDSVFCLRLYFCGNFFTLYCQAV